METALKKKWIAALRGGKYKQAQSALSYEVDGERRYCCLGVLADVVGLPWTPRGRRGERMFILEKPNTDMLPGYFAEECGLGPAANLNPPSPHRHCASMNDAGKSFEEIATWIEKNL